MLNSLKTELKTYVKSVLIAVVPLEIRKRLSIWVGKQNWISQDRRYWLSQEFVKDMKLKNVNAYHKFLWKHHLAYAQTYTTKDRYGYDNIKESRKMLFNDLDKVFQNLGVNREKDISSVLEVGCSLGYLLRYMEEHFFPFADSLLGIDIDERAISEGVKYLEQNRSIVKLAQSDMETLHNKLNDKCFDAVFCLGVLMYMKEKSAHSVVQYMLKHTKKIIVLSGLANPEFDNKYLEKSTIRLRDETFIHNFDKMIESEGGEIVYRRWEGEKLVDGNSIYFVFAKPNN